ncbi:hypothetical protein PUN4_340022 [Paraburkholderia unamae]|nr:hypothetical protein PUN4_340022 [Paraburkholderia unamae]
MGLVIIPHDVQRNAVHPHGSRHANPVLPVFMRDAGGVQFAAANLHGLAVEQEVLAMGAESETVAAFEVHDALALRRREARFNTAWHGARLYLRTQALYFPFTIASRTLNFVKASDSTIRQPDTHTRKPVAAGYVTV